MKKYFSYLSVILIAFISIIYTGCKKDKPDTVNPVVVVNGLTTCYLQKGRLYVDADATAQDDVDGTLKVTSAGDVNPSVIGTYTITYSATDLSGNKGTATRTVYVVDLEGVYTAALYYHHYPILHPSDTTRYNDHLFLGTDMQGQLNYLLWAGYSNGFTYSYLTSGTTLSIPSQTVNCGSPSIDRNFVGSGTISNVNAPHTKITIDFTEVSDSTYHSRIIYIKD